jgi:probable non-F420 flavinoid oxidoreductase
VIPGFHCSHEQHPPSTLLRHAGLAAEAGFVHAMCSDHLKPWSARQGHAGFAWSWLGAALQATPLSFGTVCAPGQRYHPAVIAQAAATLAEMYPDRFWLSVGSGEALNESITGEGWPSKADRQARLKESVAMMRALWAGETVSDDGLVRAVAARTYVTPTSPPLLLAAAISPETARWAAGWADGLITVTGDRERVRQVVDAFREHGGAGKPLFLQVTLSWAPTDEEARRAAHDQWRHTVLTHEQLADLETPEEFDRASAHADPAAVAERVRVSADMARHVAWLREDAALGFDRAYLHNVCREHQETFLEQCAARLPHRL